MRRLPQVVVEHRDRLVEPPEPVGIGQERPRQVAEVLRMDPVVRVEVGHDDLRRLEPQPHQLPVEPAAAVGHRRGLADDDPGLERIEDVEEVEEPVAEQLPQPGDVLAALRVRLAGDDRDHLPLARPVGLGQGADRLVQLLVRLGVGRDQRDVPQPVRVRERLATPGQQPFDRLALLAQPHQRRAARRRRRAALRRRAARPRAPRPRESGGRAPPADAAGRPARTSASASRRPSPRGSGGRPRTRCRSASAPCRTSRSRTSGRTRRRPAGSGTTG